MRVICDHKSGKSKGYGFVVFDSEEAAATALASMDNQVCTENFTLNKTFLLQNFMMTLILSVVCSVTRRQTHQSRICSTQRRFTSE